MEKPAAFPQTLEIETTDFHIPSAPATIANIDIQKPKGAFPSLPTVLLQAHPSIGKDSAAKRRAAKRRPEHYDVKCPLAGVG
jgi:hypothetical protein